MTESVQINPDELASLEGAYDKFLPIKHPLWGKWKDKIDGSNFRADSAYVSQLVDSNIQQYVNAFDYVIKAREWMMSHVNEDGAFGCQTFTRRGKVFSRDLLDSVLEISFLRDYLGIDGSQPKILDIGAGYGRLAHRLSEFGQHNVGCIDAVAKSTLICKGYAGFRHWPWFTYSLTDAELALHGTDIATNIHSWPEATPQSIEWWMSKLADANIKHLFVVPHNDNWQCWAEDGSRPEFWSIIKKYGYTPTHSRSKFPIGFDGPFQTVYQLFERKGK